MASVATNETLLTVGEATALLRTTTTHHQRAIRVLHKALLREPLRSYSHDMANIFFAIQGGGGVVPTNFDSATSNDDEIAQQWSVLEESLLAVAALARVCVGPAWWQQTLRRRRFRRSNSHDDDDDEGRSSGSSERQATSSSPDAGIKNKSDDSTSIQSNSSTSSHAEEITTSHRPLLVDEILPGSMLRFAASVMEKASQILLIVHEFGLERSNPEFAQRLVQRRYDILLNAQLTIVQELCCGPVCFPDVQVSLDPHDHKVLQTWNVPGAHETVGNILSRDLTWLCWSHFTGASFMAATTTADLLALIEHTTSDTREATATRIISSMTQQPTFQKQWKQIMLLLRLIRDLLSAGWRPLPRGEDGATIVVALLVIASRGIQPNDFSVKISPSYDVVKNLEGVSRMGEHAIAPLTCAAEALSDLVSLASHGWIPVEQQKTMVQCICRLKGILRTKQEVESNHLLVSNVDNASNVLRAMLSQEACVENSVELLFFMIEAATQTITDDKDFSFNSRIANKLKWNDVRDDYILTDGATAVQVLSSAIWGDDQGHSEIPLLRIFWYNGIKTIGNVISGAYSKFVDNGSPQPTSGASLGLMQSNYFVRQVQPLLLDAIEALEKAISIELRGDRGVLSYLEWNALVHAIEAGILPWLVFSTVKSRSSIVRERRPGSSGETTPAAIDQVKIVTESLVLRIAELLAYYVGQDSFPLADYACLCRLIRLLLNHTGLLDEASAQRVEVAVFRAWSKYGFFPYQLEGWKTTASEILEEAFKSDEHGRFLRSSATRLEALESVTLKTVIGEDTSTGNKDLCKTESLLTASHCSMTSLYSEIISDILLPILRRILPIECSKQATDATVSFGESSPTGNNELEFYAVDLTGRLFLSAQVSPSMRCEFISMLRSAALLGSPSTKASDISVRVEASRQIYLCLRGIFCDMPTIHENIPVLVDAVCEIFRSSVDKLAKSHDEAYFEETSALCFGALRSLSRLQLQPKKMLAFQYDRALREEADVYHSGDNVNRGRVRGVATSPFVWVDDESSFSQTLFSFRLVTNEILMALKTTSQSQRADAPFLASIRRSCWDTLSNLLCQGVVLQIPPGNVSDIFCVNNIAILPSQHLAMAKALSRATQSELACRQGQNDESALLLRLDKLVKSSPPQVMRLICRALFPVTAEKQIGDIYKTLQDRLESEIRDFKGAGENARLVASLLCALTMILSASAEIRNSLEMKRTFECCLKIISTTYLRVRCVTLHVALRCTLQIIREFDVEESQIARQKFCEIFEECIERVDQQTHSSCETMMYAPIIAKEALDQQCHLPSEGEEKRSALKSLSRTSKHLRLTEPLEQIERFVVQADENSGRLCRAAWLCENSAVLTCRLGASSSRYKGNVEVMLRTTTGCFRGLIQIPGMVSLKDPDFPSPLYEAKLSCASEQSPVIKEGDEEAVCGSFGEYKMKISSMETLDHAQSLIDRFDAMFADDDVDGNLPQKDIDDLSHSSEATQADDLSAYKSNATAISETTGTTSISSASEPQQEKICHSFISHDDSVEQPGTQSIADWLAVTFGGSYTGLELQSFLLSQGLSLAKDDICSSFKNHFFLEGKQLSYGTMLDRALSILDRTATCNTYKFGLLPYQQKDASSSAESASSEAQLLNAVNCSPAFHAFASRLGDMVPTRYLKYYSAGLDVSEYESDGRYTIAWLAPDDSSSVVFHVINLMPGDLNGRKRHIGNDNVLVVFIENASESDQLITVSQDGQAAVRGHPIVSGQFAFAMIFVRELPKAGLFRVTCQIRAGLSKEMDQELCDFASEELVAERHVGDFVRGLAMRIDLVCRTLLDSLPPPTNCLERASKIRDLQRYAF